MKEAGISVALMNVPSPRKAVESYVRRVRVPVLGELAVPPPEKVTYYAGLGVLAALQVIEWPLAVVVAAGHLLADQHLSGLARGVGDAMQQA